MGERNTIFIFYSHKDEKWLERLNVHLKPLERSGKVSIERFDGHRIKWKEEISLALIYAKISVLLISADFIASDFMSDEVLNALLSTTENDKAVILSIILNPSGFKRTKLYKFQAINHLNKPLISLTEGEQENILLQVSDAIDDALNDSDELPFKLFVVPAPLKNKNIKKRTNLHKEYLLAFALTIVISIEELAKFIKAS